MNKYFQKKFSLTEQGMKDLKNGVALTVLNNLLFMMPICGVLVVFVDMINGYFTGKGLTVSGTMYAALIIMILLLMFLINIVQYDAVFNRVYHESEVRRMTLAEKLRKLPLSFFGTRDLTDLTKVIMGDCAELEHVFSHAMVQFLGAMVSTVIAGIIFLAMDVRLGAALLWVVPISFLVIWLSRRVTTAREKAAMLRKMEVSEDIQECIENIRELKSYNLDEEYVLKIDKKIRAAEKSETKKEIVNGLMVVGGNVILRLGLGTLILIGGTLVCNGRVDFIVFFIYMAAASRFYDPLSAALSGLSDILHSEIKCDRMNEINDMPIQQGNTDAVVNGYDITFENVAFGYSDDKPVLQDVSFTAKQGQVTALVGNSGCGKSTAAKLAARFFDVTGGVIKLGGVDISTIEPESLLKYYSIVFQDVVLFNDTVMNNIRIGKKNAADEDVAAAARAAQCEEFIEKLPKGYQTIIGENGAALSGGERQRLSIARALLKDAPIVLLDEATSSLDVENESKIQAAIGNLTKGRTVVIIAHRMRTIANADKIVVLDNGIAAEQGTHTDLMKGEGLYSRFVMLNQKAATWTLK